MAEQPDIGSLIEAIPQPSVLHSPSGEIVAANRKAADVLGLTVETLLGRESFDPRWRALNGEGEALPGQDHPAMRAIEQNAPVGPSIMGVELPDGERRWIRVTATPVDWPSEAGRVGCLASFSLIQTPHALQKQEPAFIEQASRSNLFHLMSNELEKLRSSLESARGALARRDTEGAEVASSIANSSITNIAKWRDLYVAASWAVLPGRADSVQSYLSELDKTAGVFIDLDGFAAGDVKNAYIAAAFIHKFLNILSDEDLGFTLRVNFDGTNFSHIDCYSGVRYSDIYKFLGAHIYDVVSFESYSDLRHLCLKELCEIICSALYVNIAFINSDQSVHVRIAAA